MIRLFRRKPRPEPNLQAFYESLILVRATHDGPYTFEDRYRDFRSVFGSDAGRRVLAQIINECEGLPIGLGEAEKSHARLAFRAGQRFIGQRIVQMMNAVPPALEEEDHD